ncbi:uncharacterized protein LOC127903156 [Citrus sinensis]|uniref:uncharacterized protein LOC127903156 n=1 Tax=Citrus sinensis TaxID=2711 RepID=UPI002277DB5F|nr:uncharacterized protein LOC127903156 [Citrus sinensis]
MGQLATAMSSRTQGSLPSNTDDPRRESKEHCKVISLRSRKHVDIPVKVTKNGMECNSAKKPTKKGSMLQQIHHQDIDARDPATATAKEIQPDLAEKEVTTPVATTCTNLNKQSLRRLGEFETVALTQESSHMLQSKIPTKFKDPGSFTIPYSIGNRYVGRALCDLGASINLMPLSVFKQLGVGECRPTTITLQLADISHAYPEGKIEDVLVKVDKFIFPVDFIVLDFEADKEVPIILGRPFLATGKTLIDVQKREMTMRVNDQQVTFNVLEAMRNSDELEDCNFLSVVDLVVADRMDRCCSNVLNKVTTFEEVEEEDVAAIQTDWMDKQQSNRHNRVIEHLNLSDRKAKSTLPSIESPPSQEQSLVDLLGKYRRAIGWTMAYIKGISPSIYMHKILLEDCSSNSVEHQRRLNPIMKEVVKKEIIKWLDAGIIYPISDSSWIVIAPEDQEKTTFICPYGTFAFRRMPFGLCNAPTTF